jgi:class 3 adenylate cyclase
MKPSVLLIGIAVCLPLLAAMQFGVMHDLTTPLRRWADSFAPLSPLPWLSYAMFTLTAFFSAWVVTGLVRQVQRFAFLTLLSVLLITLVPCLAMLGWFWEPVSSVLAAWAAGLLAMLFAVRDRGSRVQAFERFFVDRLRRDQFDQLVQSHEPVRLTGKRDITTLTCRVLNSTDLCAQLEPEAMEQLMSAFLHATSRELIAQGAYIETCDAQRLIAHIGFPVARSDHAAKACDIALHLRGAWTELKSQLEEHFKAKVELGCSLTTGSASAGLVGHDSFQTYRVQSAQMPLGMSLCGMNQRFGSMVIVSASTFNAAHDHIDARPLELLTESKGSVQEVYELLAIKGTLSDTELAARDAFWQGIVALRQKDATTAQAKFRQALIVGKEDAPLRYFKQQAEALEKSKA